MAENKKKMPVAMVMTILLSALSGFLLAYGAITPPPGEIHGSILQGCGILFGFATLWVTAHTIIEVYRDGKISAKIGNASLTIEDTNKEESK